RERRLDQQVRVDQRAIEIHAEWDVVFLHGSAHAPWAREAPGRRSLSIGVGECKSAADGTITLAALAPPHPNPLPAGEREKSADAIPRARSRRTPRVHGFGARSPR